MDLLPGQYLVASLFLILPVFPQVFFLSFSHGQAPLINSGNFNLQVRRARPSGSGLLKLIKALSRETVAEPGKQPEHCTGKSTPNSLPGATFGCSADRMNS